MPALLHTPLMSATNAISGISLVGSLVAAGADRGWMSATLGFIAVTAATINVVGGFMITDRMLKMFQAPGAQTVMPLLAAADSGRRRSALRDLFIEICYLVASALFIFGLRGLTAPDKARRGMQLAAVGMLLAVIGTLLHHEIVDFKWIVIGLVARLGDRRGDLDLDADDCHSAADRDLARLWRAGRDAGGHRALRAPARAHAARSAAR